VLETIQMPNKRQAFNLGPGCGLAIDREKQVDSNKNLIFVSFIIYFLSVDFAYKFFMLQQWGLDFLETSWGYGPRLSYSWGVCFIVFLLSAYLVSRIQNRPSDFLHTMFFAVPIVPMMVISANKGIGHSFVLYSLLAFWISYRTSVMRFRLTSLRVGGGFVNEKFYLRCCASLGMAIVVWMVAKGGLAYWNLDFSSVYEHRRLASSSRGTLLNYAMLNYVGILLGLGFAIAFAYRNMVYVCILTSINVAIYALTSNKAYLFVGLFTFGVYVILGTKKPKAMYVLLLSATCVGLTLLYVALPSQWIWGTLFIRRYIFVPAYANFLYWEFFTDAPYAFWSDSKVGLGIVASPYGRPTPQVIADYFTGVDFTDTVQEFGSANTGWLGSGFGNAGVMGMMVYAILSGLVTKYANSLAGVVGERVAIASVSFYFFAIFFTSTDLPAALLTYGFLSLIVIVMFWNRPAGLGSRMSAAKP